MLTLLVIREEDRSDLPEKNSGIIKFNIAEKPKTEDKAILEAKQEETEAPDDASHLGQVNHKTKKEQRIDPKKIVNARAADPGSTAAPARTKTTSPSPSASLEKPKSKPPTLQPGQGVTPPRNDYEKLLARAYDGMSGEMSIGYRDYIDDTIADGEAIDINTQEFRYIGYFTSMRKAIELVWNYPALAARRGWHGAVGLKFNIQQNGTVEDVAVLHSSGYQVLDRAIVDAIKLAAPFPPLPPGFNKKILTVKGTFSYILSSYYAAGP